MTVCKGCRPWDDAVMPSLVEPVLPPVGFATAEPSFDAVDRKPTPG